MKKIVTSGKRGKTSERREPSERYSQIHHMLAQQEYPSCAKLASRLGVGTRTIKRDIEHMRLYCDLPIAYCARRNAYYYTRPVTWMPLLPNITREDALGLLIARKAAGQYEGLINDETLRAAYEKLSWRLSQTELFQLNTCERALSFRPFAPEELPPGLLVLARQAVEERRVLHFTYRNGGTLESKPRQVRPYHVFYADNRWYVVGHDEARNEPRTFVLRRMTDLFLTDTRFERPANFDLNQHFKGSLTVMNGQGDYEVTIEFDQWATDILDGRRWHASQELILLRGGSRLRLRLNNLEEMERWVLSWGVHATVIAPNLLRERLANICTDLAKRYDPAGTQ